MIIKGVEFPEQLIFDQRHGKLVIFAGAGVSLDRPSSLPSFVNLTERIIFRKLKKNEKGQLDRILGANKQTGVNVHRVAREIIDKEGSRPTVLHGALLSLFSDPLTVRVVTTNFDRHFSTSAKKLFSDPLEEYYAPALPLGHEFNGIVYLHGSLEREEQRFVLTDSDFGRAYLTEGWATRFLWALFRTYTVLFVGYSHNDPVMHYLSKGLPSETIGKRYALTPGSDTDRWKSLDIIPLPYPVRRRSHKAMTTAVSAWAKLSEMGALDYKHRIKSIVEGSTYLSDEDSSFILYALKHTSYAKFFAMYAERLDWLAWAERNDLLKPLFQPDSVGEKHFAVLADWITDKYLFNHTDEVLALIQRQGQYLNSLLWNEIARRLYSANSRPEPTTLSRIISILLMSSHPMNRIENLDLLLLECNTPELESVALLLFEFLTTPRISLQRSFSLEEEDVNDWLQMAVNHPGGKVAEFWIYTLSRARKASGDSWTGLPDAHRQYLGKIIAGTSLEAQLARVFIASQLHFMFYLDEQWGISHVLPLLDWSDPLRARQCWDGYLFWGRFGEDTLPHVMPLYRRTFRELHAFRDVQRRRFCEHMAAIAIYSSMNPLENGWLHEFISSVEEAERTAWARQLGHILRGLDDEATKLLWDQWLGKYWHLRNLGQPAPLSQSELGAMVKWSSCLESVFNKAVKMICEQSAPDISDSYMFHQMNAKELAKKHPKELAKLLIHLIPQMTKPWICRELSLLFRSLREAGLDPKLLTNIQNGLLTLGCNEDL